MRPELEEIELIERYLANELSNEEKLQLDSRCLVDQEFAKKVELQSILQDRIEIASLKADINLAHNKFISSGGANGLTLAKVLGISIVVVGTGLGVWWLSITDSSEENKATVVEETIRPEQSVVEKEVEEDLNDQTKVEMNVERFEHSEAIAQNKYKTGEVKNLTQPILRELDASFQVEIVDDEFIEPIGYDMIQFLVDCEEGGSFIYRESDIILHIPPGTLKYEGKPAKGDAIVYMIDMSSSGQMIGYMSSTGGSEFQGDITNYGMFSIMVNQAGKTLQWDRKRPMFLEFPVSRTGEDLKLFYKDIYADEELDWLELYPVSDMPMDFERTSRDDLVESWRNYIKGDLAYSVPVPNQKLIPYGLNEEVMMIEHSKDGSDSRSSSDSLNIHKRAHRKGVVIKESGVYRLAKEKSESVAKYISPIWVDEEGNELEGITGVVSFDQETRALSTFREGDRIPLIARDMVVLLDNGKRYFFSQQSFEKAIEDNELSVLFCSDATRSFLNAKQISMQLGDSRSKVEAEYLVGKEVENEYIGKEKGKRFNFIRELFKIGGRR